KELCEERDATGALRLRCGNIAVHLFRCDFLERMVNDKNSLPIHRSSKAVPHLNDTGEAVQPDKPNAYKFEKFIFDILPKANRPLAMEVIREDEFTPLKNKEGAFSAEHVRKALRQLHSKWLKLAGWTNESELPVEIPASVALDGAEFVERFGR